MSTSQVKQPGGAGDGALVHSSCSGVEPTAHPDYEPPCEVCIYTVYPPEISSGALSTTYPYYPLTGMTLTLKDSSGGVLDTITGLRPDPAYGGNSLVQSIDTNVTSGVASATVSWTNSQSQTVSQSLTVR